MNKIINIEEGAILRSGLKLKNFKIPFLMIALAIVGACVLCAGVVKKGKCPIAVGGSLLAMSAADAFVANKVENGKAWLL